MIKYNISEYFILYYVMLIVTLQVKMEAIAFNYTVKACM